MGLYDSVQAENTADWPQIHEFVQKTRKEERHPDGAPLIRKMLRLSLQP